MERTMETPKNFQPQIHDRDHRAAYTAHRIGSGSLICTAGRECEPLDGPWSFAVDQYDTCLRARWFEEQSRDAAGRLVPLDYDFSRMDPMPVPSCWNLARERYFLYEGPAIYMRTFRFVGEPDERVFLRIGAAQYEAFVFLNGRYLGCHRGGSTPFCIELTGKLQDENRLLIVVDATRRPHQVPPENTDWFNYGGLYRSVGLYRVPETFIRDFTVRLEPGSGFGRIAASIRIDSPAGKPPAAGEAVLEIPELGVKRRISVIEGAGALTFEAVPELWSPDNPKLYDVVLSYGTDTVRDRIGFREISVSGQEILLNGRPVFLKGMSVHEESLIHGKAVTEQERREIIRIAKDLGCTYLRLAHYPHSEAMARLADEAGLMLWEEIPVYWAVDFANPDTYADAENQLSELIVRDRNRASVIIWSVGNENPDTDERLSFMSRLAMKAKELDPTRPVSAACLVNHVKNVIEDRLEAYLDIIGLNEYYGWYDPEFGRLVELFTNSAPEKPVVICEFGAGARAGFHGTKDELFTEECQKYVYELQIGTIRRIPYVRGMSPWILYDFRCPRRFNRYQEGYNRKGLLAEDMKTKKLAYDVLRVFYRGMK
jgi:beta-glucuronidase